ncbi:MAG: hydantoinase/oxoprolinase family protein [Rhizobiaceae bacterium]|nr:hydantoinase/oxoprolinase family protein [Rhizobiaceae bacterium]
MKFIGVDVGGTFTDLIVCDMRSGDILTHKVSTTPDDPSIGVMNGITEICKNNAIDPSAIDHVFHGTTTATNAVLENKGARTGMITNEGFRDVIHIGRHQRVHHYSIMQELPWQNRPLVARRYRKTVAGRLVPPSGEELVALDEKAVRRVARELRAEGVEAVAVCFLFSYLNSAHEDRAREIVQEEMPDAFVTTSSHVSSQFREFERFTTAALAAFIGPKVERYIDHLNNVLHDAGMRADLRIMASNGGVATPEMVVSKPALTLMSGLAAGVLGGAMVGKLAGRDRLITFDIGGTSADIGILLDGDFAETDARSTSIAGFPIVLPMIDIHTIGAGGGSIAHIDPGGAFKVGPQSAGAAPGPAAYGRGGNDPTVTDANIVLGRLDPDNFLGGAMTLDREASHRVIEELASRLKLTPVETAEGIITIINANMANAIYSRTVQKGIDPRSFALVALGGAGPLHAAEVARQLGIPEVIIPPYPGITSAMGLLTTDLKYDEVRTQFQNSDSVDLSRLNADFLEMEKKLAAHYRSDKIAKSNVSFRRFADLRYVGQGYELKVAVPAGKLTSKSIQNTWRAFHKAHKREYGHAFAESTIEIVNIRVSGLGKIPKLNRFEKPGGTSVKKALRTTRQCIFRVGGKPTEFQTGFYQRDMLPAGGKLKGPAVVLQTDSTTIVPPGATAKVDDSGSVIITLGKGK